MGLIAERAEAVFASLKAVGKAFRRGYPRTMQERCGFKVNRASVTELKAIAAKAYAVSQIATMDGFGQFYDEHLADYQKYADGLVELKEADFTGPEGLVLKGRALQARDDCERLTRIFTEGRMAESRLEEIEGARKEQRDPMKGAVHKIS